MTHCVRPEFAPDKGWYYVATQALNEGDELLCEQAFAWSINSSFQRRTCFRCLTRCARGCPESCSRCRSRFYCSRTCADQDGCSIQAAWYDLPAETTTTCSSTPMSSNAVLIPPTDSATPVSIGDAEPTCAIVPQPLLLRSEESLGFHDRYECTALKHLARTSKQLTIVEWDEVLLLVSVLARRAAILDGTDADRAAEPQILAAAGDGTLDVQQQTSDRHDLGHTLQALEQLTKLFSDASSLSASDTKSYNRIVRIVLRSLPSTLLAGCDTQDQKIDLLMRLCCAIRFNSFGLWQSRSGSPDEAIGSFISLLASRFNHSCVPNASRAQV
jgi:hypothetical protein